MRKHKVSFKARGRRISFMAGGHRRSTTTAKRRAAGRALARKYGFVRKSGKLYRKSPRRGLVRVRR